ncbi:C39 family peptidase [Vallitalea okinawensis]|uniref:C39 family peptidase n=1 Tax=Vallitalea okinawensis TaxID=2078660 RepID=UPI0013001C3C|nr:C39 family peptidase [Vallitalea okinawensis]
MKKLFMGLMIALTMGIAYMLLTFPLNLSEATSNQLVEQPPNSGITQLEEIPDSNKNTFDVYRYDTKSKQFSSLEEAINYAEDYTRAYIIQDNQEEWIWDNFNPYIVYSEDTYLKDFITFQEAYEYAKNFQSGIITYEDEYKRVWMRDYDKRGSSYMEVPKLNQYPELPRGCEVTSLAMLMNYNALNVTKMQLAEEIVKEPGLYWNDSLLYYGNPHQGFVGSMYSLSQFGFGVYHEPINQLVKAYAPADTLDFTGTSFEEIYFFLDHGMPVWVITNTLYKALDDNYFKTWKTEEGDVTVTNKQHAVVVVGYDEEYIYINDPLNRRTAVKKEEFIAAWEQMGNQAITMKYIAG